MYWAREALRSSGERLNVSQSAEWILTSRVLRRSGFGARGTEVDSLLKQGDTDSLVKHLVKIKFDEDPGVIATPMPDLKVFKRPEKTEVTEYKRYRAKHSAQMQGLTEWWLRRMAAAEQPLVEKLTLLWHNHFATSATKVRNANLIGRQNNTLRQGCLGDFKSLAFAMLTDGAMIHWLDGQENKSGRPNENLAREFMELFALGHGSGYTEQDVREGARALTGWRAEQDGEVRLVAKHYDDAEKTVFDTTGEIGAAELCDIVLAQPTSAPFIAGRLWQRLASDEPAPPDTMQRLVDAYGADRDLRALTRAILTDPNFVNKTATVVSSPVEWVVGIVRSLRVDIDETKSAGDLVKVLRSLGQLPFYPPDVGGWPRGQAWLSTSAANIRIRTARKLVQAGDLSLVSDSPRDERIDAVGYLIGVGAWSDRTVKALKSITDPADLFVAAVNTPEYLTS